MGGSSWHSYSFKACKTSVLLSRVASIANRCYVLAHCGEGGEGGMLGQKRHFKFSQEMTRKHSDCSGDWQLEGGYCSEQS